ncbi:MAG: flagellar basal body-associated FliL family protein [Burkholderiales bacterium]|nr:flagellar basal body-associated FliL family protein [Burkholderiales bacterium]
MSAAAAPPPDAGAAVPAKKGKKKLIIMIAAALLVVIAGGGGAAFYLKKKAAAAAAAEESADEAGAAGEHKLAKRDPKHPPTFLPLDPFVVNLADKDADRYAQIGITLELQDLKFADELKLYMPAIRNGILMILAHKTSGELLDRSGKELLAQQVQREAARTMGIDVAEPEAVTETKPADAPATEEGDDEVEKKPKKKAKKAVVEPNPIVHVHFSNFIIQ